MGVFDKFSGIGVASGFKLQAKAPIDPRQVVDTIDDRDALITENGAYDGMQVYVKADKKTYLLKDLAAGTWEELGSGGGASELLTIEISVSITETTADVLKTYLNNNPDVLAKLEVASSFILKENRQNIAVPEIYVFEQNFKDTAFAVQHYFICVHAYGKDTTRSTILWFSIVSGAVKDITIRYHELRSGIPDYNQNDSTAADYIKNRPFYEEIKEETLLEQTFSTMSASGMNIWATQDNVIQLTEGDTVKVTFNGVEYTETVKLGMGILVIGNVALVGLTPNTGEPFVIANIYFPAGLDNPVAGTSIATAVAQTNATIKVEKIEEIVTKMPEKYLPIGTATETYVDTAISNAITKTLNTEV